MAHRHETRQSEVGKALLCLSARGLPQPRTPANQRIFPKFDDSPHSLGKYPLHKYTQYELCGTGYMGLIWELVDILGGNKGQYLCLRKEIRDSALLALE